MADTVQIVDTSAAARKLVEDLRKTTQAPISVTRVDGKFRVVVHNPS